MQHIEEQDDPRVIVDRLMGQTCPFCDDRRLESEKHKGSQAVVCEGCGTPIVQL
ncbi:hypothetical protein [Natrinema gelatinilyticum]|uniref:hypothetical protein n=1 Tax=Natrinema gelatinilyticum TaxID=2961571 RepID=UPI0020C3FFBD|nr:hypothetical protein [Natrinema gelatinilyticum]